MQTIQPNCFVDRVSSKGEYAIPEYAIPEFATLLSDTVSQSIRTIRYRKSNGCVVMLKIGEDGECEEAEINTSGRLIGSRRFRVYFPAHIEGSRWEVSLISPNTRALKCAPAERAVHAVARQFCGSPARLLIEHFGQMRLEPTESACLTSLPHVVARCTYMKFRTIEYNVNPYYLKGTCLLEMRIPSRSSTVSSSAAGTNSPILTMNETQFTSGDDIIGRRRSFSGNDRTSLPAWVLERFDRALSMLFGDAS